MKLSSGELVTQAKIRRVVHGVPSSYSIYREGSDYYAEANSPNMSDVAADTDFDSVMQTAINNLTNGGKIFLHDAVFEADTGLTFPANKEFIIEGVGYSGQWDGGFVEAAQDKGTVIKATSSMTSLIDISTAAANEYMMVTLRDLTINGDDNATNGVYIKKSYRRLALDNVNISDCTTGLYITDSWILDFFSSQVEQCTTGIKMEYTTDAVNSCNFIGGRVEGCTTGIHVKKKCDSNTFWGIELESNSGNEFKFERSGDGVTGIPTNNKIIACTMEEVSKTSTYEMILFTDDGTPTTWGGVQFTRIRDNTFTTNNDITAIHFEASVANVITGNLFSSGAGTIYVTIDANGATKGNDQNQIFGNIKSGTFSLGDSGFRTQTHHNNLTWITENSGSDSIASGTTSKVITHGLSVTPSAEHINIIGKEDPTNAVGTVWVDTITSTQFTVHVENDPGASNWDFGWQVIVI